MKDKILGIYFVVLSFVIYTLYFVGYLNNFLAAKMIMFSLISATILLVLGLLILFNKIKNLKLSKNTCILIIPLIMIVIANDGKLSLELAKKRGSNLSVSIADKTNNNSTSYKPEENKENKENKVENNHEINDDNYIEALNYLYLNMDEVKGDTVKISGFAIKDAPFVTEGHFVIGKYVISCCAADAGVVGILVKDSRVKVNDKGWYEIEGVIDVVKDKYQKETVIIRPKKATPIVPGNMYVYETYTYE